MQHSLGLPDPRDHSSLPILRHVQAGIKHANLGTGTARVRLPVTPQLLWQIKQKLEAIHHNERVVIWAVSCVALFGCFRLGELLLESTASFDQHRHSAWGDVTVDNQADPWMLRIHLKQSKTDQFGRGADITVGKTGTDLQGCESLGFYPNSRILSYHCSYTDGFYALKSHIRIFLRAQPRLHNAARALLKTRGQGQSPSC